MLGNEQLERRGRGCRCGQITAGLGIQRLSFSLDAGWLNVRLVQVRLLLLATG